MSKPELWRDLVAQFEALARAHRLDIYPVEFECVPDSVMLEIAVYGLPIRMPHWSFGVRYLHQFVQRRMGLSRLFEVVFPGNPGHAYLSQGNGVAENALVIAHVLGHADFSRNNLLFRRCHEQVAPQIVEHAAANARVIQGAIERHGAARVEAVLDAALALEQHIDIDQSVRRALYPGVEPPARMPPSDEFGRRYATLGGTASEPAPSPTKKPRRLAPPHPERDLLWFLASYAPELEGWERDIFLAVREESFYFFPVFATQIMNEGWACYWHATLMREANFVPNQAYVDAIKIHSDVVRPMAGGQQVALQINPYHLGFCLWEDIVAERGIAAARQLMHEEDDCSFVRNFLTRKLAEKLSLFRYRAHGDGRVSVIGDELTEVQEAIIAPKFSFGAPLVAVTDVHVDGTLELHHDHRIDGRGLDPHRAHKVLEYLREIWRRPIVLHTVDQHGVAMQLSVSPLH